MKRPYLSILDYIDRDWAIKESRMMMAKYPIFCIATSSGKFFETYCTWCFHRSSQLPLVKEFFRIVDDNKEDLKRIFGFDHVDVRWFRLNLTPDSSKEVCVWHKDGVYWDGQIHATILNNAHLSIRQKNEKTENEWAETNINMPDGTIWYMSTTDFLHRINPTNKPFERIEGTCPVNMSVPTSEAWEEILEDDYARYVNTSDPRFAKINSGFYGVEYNKQARQKRSWTANYFGDTERVVYNNQFTDWSKPMYLDDYMKIYRRIEEIGFEVFVKENEKHTG